MDFALPELGEGVYEADLVRWLVGPGEAVKRGQPLLEVMTDKATMEVPAPFAGKITTVGGEPGARLKVGQTILTYQQDGPRVEAAPVAERAVAVAAPVAASGATSASAAAGEAPPSAGEPSTAGRDPAATGKPSVKAPLTGIFYASPAPGTAPYVQAGGEVAVGQVIGLIEAMKLFNEIKSDLAGRVVRVVPESGALVKAKQPLIEVEPL